MKHGNNPMQLADVKRCGAKTRSGKPCEAPAVKGKLRCRMHGGNSPGAPKGNKNAFKHGLYSTDNVTLRSELTRTMKKLKILIGLAS